MKTFLAIILLLTMLTYETVADDTAEIFGTITTVDYDKGNFSVKTSEGKTYTFFVNNLTDIDIENQNYMQDRYYQLADMRTGDWVQVEYFMSDPARLIADEIDIYR